jgi:hypothetical protein
MSEEFQLSEQPLSLEVLLSKYTALENKYNNDLSAAYVKIRELEAALAELRFSEAADS